MLTKRIGYGAGNEVIAAPTFCSKLTEDLRLKYFLIVKIPCIFLIADEDKIPQILHGIRKLINFELIVPTAGKNIMVWRMASQQVNIASVEVSLESHYANYEKASKIFLSRLTKLGSS